MAKVGDTVRFLNTIGGGRIIRIEGQVAYVDEDGFETPVLLRECVVVATGDSFYKSELNAKRQAAAQPAPQPEPKKSAPQKADLPPVEETPEGEKLNIVLGFEPIDIKRLSDTTFDAYLVNDSNYALYASISTKASNSEKWTLRYAGYIEPSLQEFVFELTPEELPEIDRIAVQAISFKRSSDYSLKPSIAFEQKLDSTKFARLHCFTQNPYFDSKVIAIEIVKDDIVQHQLKIDARQIEKAITEKREADSKLKNTKISKPAHKPSVLEIDLHAGALLDNFSGLSKADILNYQIDTFRKVMDENLKFPGRKIVFIHGKGEGILRQAIMKELNHRYKGHDVADASFREYGFGATQVTIRSQKP